MPDELAARLGRVTRELGAVAAGASLCTISRSGGAVDGAKHLEGRMAALSELRRALRGAGDDSPETVVALAEPILATWRADLAARREREAGKGWVAYRAGGVDELEDVIQALGAGGQERAPEASC